MKKAKKIKSDMHIESVEVHCIAMHDGYYGGIVRKPGAKFTFKGNLKNGEFPTWCKPSVEFESEFSKLQASGDLNFGDSDKAEKAAIAKKDIKDKKAAEASEASAASQSVI